MASLMTLPRELRDRICMFAILSPKQEVPVLDLTPAPGVNDEPALLDGRISLLYPRLSAWSSQDLVRYQSDSAYVASSTPLLLVNRQLHDETVSNFKVFQDLYSYDLDIIILDEIMLLPTWLRVPALTTRVDTVRATFRIAGSFERNKKWYPSDSYKGFRIGDGAGPAMAWTVYSLLDRFFKVGPSGSRSKKSKVKDVRIGSLHINVETPEGIDARRFDQPLSSWWRAGAEEEGHVLDPDHLAKFLVRQIEYLLSMSYHSADYGRILYEHLNEIVISKDGEELLHIDVAERFKKLRFTDSFSSDEDRFNEWKAKTPRRRRDLGLLVLEDWE